MTLSRVKPYTKRAFRSKGTASSTEFVRRIPVIPELMVKDTGFLIIRIGVGATIEIEVDVFPLVYMNCSFNFEYIVQYMISSSL